MGSKLKISFGVNKTVDRHKWITNIKSINRFINHADKEKWKIEEYNFLFFKEKKIFIILL